ncbi:MAG TPA: hypothetical protein VHR47_13460 [Bacillota bacterium]|nr:hypothetical protein [Bacillota bacterium]
MIEASWLYRFFAYGLLGWGMEILWTGLGSLLQGNLRLTGHSYLWMFPIYGGAGMLMECIHEATRFRPWLLRGIIWLAVIWSVEYVSGWSIKSVTGECPWDYRQSTRWTIKGFIRWDYGPAWLIAGLIFERVHDFLASVLK